MKDSERILGIQVRTINYDQTCDRILAWATAKQSCYVIAANVHVIMTAVWQPDYQQIVNQAALITPDGMPLVWALKRLGRSAATRVYGPDLMLKCCQRAAQEKVHIYLYGGTNIMLQKLQENLLARFPTLQIAGTHAPPFRELTDEETAADIDRIHQSGAAIVFVALGCPKQEIWMAQHQGKLQAVMIGVGAAFGFHSGTVSQSPRWMMNLGLEWFYRLAVEPRRLWKRYLINNPVFVILLAYQLFQYKFKAKS
jgi:N-acetylglucosaminyldiphosphoundecaprenol N-acetyl-beta-D-mannosaminyltransferase